MTEPLTEQAGNSGMSPSLAAVPRLPATIRVDISKGLPPHSPRETQMIETGAGMPLREFVNGDSLANIERVAAFLALRRLGYEPTWEDTLDIIIETPRPEVEPDPTNGDASPTSPSSVTSGG